MTKNEIPIKPRLKYFTNQHSLKLYLKKNVYFCHFLVANFYLISRKSSQKGQPLKIS